MVLTAIQECCLPQPRKKRQHRGNPRPAEEAGVRGRRGKGVPLQQPRSRDRDRAGDQRHDLRFCGSAVVLSDRLSGELAPVMVIPFSITKEEAMKAFKKWCRNGLLTPSGFMTANRIKEITGIYVPFWLYELHNRVEVHGHGTKVRTHTQGDYQYTETQHFDIYRKIRLNYVKVPIDASEKMNDELMDKLEPFPYQQLKEFKTPYLAGYIAEKYSHDEERSFHGPRIRSAPTLIRIFRPRCQDIQP